MRRLFAITIFLSLSFSAAIAQDFRGTPWFSATQCTDQDAQAAEMSTDHLSSWIVLQRTFKRYGKCDDGAIAEGFSDGVAKLLVRHWETLPDFAKLAHIHPQFGQFVFRHIDETWNLEDCLAVVENARKRCPDGLKSLCVRLERKAKPPAGPQ